jgi:EF hand
MRSHALPLCVCVLLACALTSGAAARPEPQSNRYRGGPAAWFRIADTNHDGVLTPEEWQAAFDRLDRDHDRRLGWNEIVEARETTSASVDLSTKSPAYRAGYERGLKEGREAGLGDKPRQWDLEGQRELEQADSGYEASMGPRTEYQEGYRAGFRLGYAEGFGPRK